MQHGPSRPVDRAENHRILPYDALLDLCRAADAVVLQGGAGGVMDMRAIGVVPIVVPRVPGGGEVVDDHQLVFTAEMARLGLLRRALTYAELDRQLGEALAGGGAAAESATVATPGAAAVAELIEAGIGRTGWATVAGRFARTGASLVAARLPGLRPSAG